MTAMNARLGAERGPGLALGVAALALFGVLCGVGVAMGELQALIGVLTLVACCAVFIDFRVGAVLLMALLPIYPSFYNEDQIHFTDAFGYLRDLAVKPLLMVVAALLIGAALAQSKKAERFLVPIIVAVWVMCILAISYVVSSGVSLGILATASERGFFSGIGMHANDLGRLYAVAYGLLLFTWGETRDYSLKTVLLVTMAVLTIALIL